MRQVQAHEAPRSDLRQVWRGSHAVQGPPRAPRPHRAGVAVLACVVLQGTAQPYRPPARHFFARSRSHSLLRGLCNGRAGRCSGEGPRGHQRRDQVPRTRPAIPPCRLQSHDGRGSDQGTTQARRHRFAFRRTAREDAPREFAAEAAEVRQAPQSCRSLPQERQQAATG